MGHQDDERRFQPAPTCSSPAMSMNATPAAYVFLTCRISPQVSGPRLVLVGEMPIDGVMTDNGGELLLPVS